MCLLHIYTAGFQQPTMRCQYTPAAADYCIETTYNSSMSNNGIRIDNYGCHKLTIWHHSPSTLSAFSPATACMHSIHYKITSHVI
jgi:hypothetical protein